MEFKNDLGKPWRFQEGGYTVTRSCVWSPPGCHPVGCGIKYYVNDKGILEKVEGDENQPITKGRLCVRCLTMTDYVYHPDRVTYPMKRAVEDRGKDRWERISWDEAYALIAEKVNDVKRRYGAESIVVFGGTGRQGGQISTATHRVIGSPNACYTQSGYSCYCPRVANTSYLLGAPYPEMDYAGGLPGGYDDPMFKVPEVIMMWGKEPLPSNPDGLFGHAVIDLMKRGAKLISVDPRVNWLATRATIHLRLRAGTDTALGMAMLHIIINEDLYDHDFVDRWCYGFDELADRINDPERGMTPEKAAEICGIDVNDIYEATRMYANGKPSQLVWGLANDQKSNGVQQGQVSLALMAITGNLDVPGGQTLMDITDGLGDADVSALGWSMLPQETQNKILGMEEYPAYCGITMNAQADLMLEALETDKPYPIRLGWITSTNFLSPTNSAQPKRWHDACLKSLEFCFATDVWMTPTIMALADVFLPLAACPEHDAVVTNHYGGSPNLIGAINKAIEVGETKSDIQIYWELGSRCMPHLWEGRYDSLEDWIQEYSLEGTDFIWDELKKDVSRQRKVSYRKYETGLLRPDGKPGFATATGRVELYATQFVNWGEDPLPYYEEPQYSPISTPEIMEKYPFVLTTGAREYAYFHSEGRQIPYLRELCPDPLVEIHPDVANEKGIIEGEWVVIENQFGSCKMRAKLTPAVDRNTIHAQHGWWFPEEDGEEPNLFGVWKSNINNLIPHKHIGKLGFGAPYKCIICDVSKIKE